MVRAYLPQHSKGLLTTNTNTPPQGEIPLLPPPGFDFWIDNLANIMIDDESNKFVFVEP